jgi:hypothetical protein
MYRDHVHVLVGRLHELDAERDRIRRALAPWHPAVVATPRFAVAVGALGLFVAVLVSAGVMQTARIAVWLPTGEKIHLFAGDRDVRVTVGF